MDNKIFQYIVDQIEFLKKDLAVEIPLNMNSEYQPNGAAKIVETREATKQKILELLNRMMDIEQQPAREEYFRKLMDDSMNDKEVAVEAMSKLDEIVQNGGETFGIADAITNIVNRYYDQKTTVMQSLFNKKD